MSQNRQNKQTDFTIKHFVNQDADLPAIVLEKKQAAYKQIYSQAAEGNVTRLRRVRKKNTFSHGRHLSRAAAITLACLLTAGGTALAAGAVLTRWERLQNMDSQEIAQYCEELQHSGNLTFLSSRRLSEQEQIRYSELEKAYKNNTRLPECEIARLEAGAEYPGQGVCLMMTEAGEENILYLPDSELTDEELLEIIEYHIKQSYALSETRRQELLEKGNWETRLENMTDGEVEDYYLAYYTSCMPTSGGYRRASADQSIQETDLTKAEASRYQTLQTAYEEENRFPQGSVTVIELPQDYSGSGVALCRSDANFYLPESELTDEEILEIIDFRRKADYSLNRINEDILFGRRSALPSLPQTSAFDSSAIVSKAFAETDGKGQLQEIADAKTGDIIRFGTYEQNHLAEDGKEAVEWYVLDCSEDALTLLSVKILDSGSYASDLTYTPWKDSDLRRWLNEDFYKNAFSETEQTLICSTALENYESDATTDRVYLLSYEEVLSYFGIDTADIDSYGVATPDEAAMHCLKTLDSRLYAEATESARADGLWYWTDETTKAFAQFKHLDFSPAEGKSSWWLRSVYNRQTPGARTIEAGGLVDSVQYVNTTSGIRPVIRIRRD